MKSLVCLFIFGFCAWLSYGDEASREFSSRYKIDGRQNNIANSTVDSSVVEGKKAKKNEFPWLVALLICGKGKCNRCEGSLIDLDVVLTAAHCVSDQKSGDLIHQMSATAGDHDLGIEEDTEQTLTAVNVIRHDKFKYISDNLKGFPYDIALIKLSKKFEKTSNVSPIGLPEFNTTGRVCSNGKGIVAGWEFTNSDDYESSNILMKAEVREDVTSEKCDYMKSDLQDGQLCAGKYGESACFGVAGGPFVCKNDPNILQGISSYGKCGAKGIPMVYTKVSVYVPWIMEQLTNFESVSSYDPEINIRRQLTFSNSSNSNKIVTSLSNGLIVSRVYVTLGYVGLSMVLAVVVLIGYVRCRERLTRQKRVLNGNHYETCPFPQQAVDACDDQQAFK